MSDETEIKDGLEWPNDDGHSIGWCARCGSSVEFLDCWNCDCGYVDKDFGDGIVEDVDTVACEYCDGAGGSWHCLSTPEFCQANPMAGREEIASTALKPEAWRE